jgi:hypothetical protein
MIARIDPGRRRTLAGLCLGLAGTALLGACAGLMGPPRVHFSEGELNQMLARRFPAEKRLLQTLDVTLSHPDLRLKPETDRLATSFDITAADRLFGQRWQGHLALEYALKLDASEGTLRMAEPRVTELRIDEGVSAQAQRIGALVLESMLDGLVLHRLKPEQLQRLADAGLAPGEVRVRADGVEITTVPRR